MASQDKYLAPYEVARRAVVRSLLPEGTGPALDIGSGPGALSADLTDRGWSPLSIDVEPGGSIRPTRADARSLPIRDGSVGLVCCLELIEHVTEQAQLLEEVRRVLRPGGHLVLSTPNRLSLQALAGWLLYRRQGRRWDYGDATHVAVRTSFSIDRMLRAGGFAVIEAIGLQLIPHKPPVLERWAYGATRTALLDHFAYNYAVRAQRLP